jgi:predicted kinase
VQPTLIVVGGLPGTGKSTLADGLAARLDVPVFNKDWIEASLRRDGVTRERDSWRVAEHLLTTLAHQQLRRRQSAILDTVARPAASRAAWRSVADGAGARFRLIQCVCADVGVHRRRVLGRTRGIPDWDELTWSDVEDVRARSAPWPEPHLVLDAVRPPAENLEAALQYVCRAATEPA